MSERIKRPCAQPGCSELVVRGFCGAHVKPLYERPRESSSKRGYDGAWRKFRKWFLAQPGNAVCADCKQASSTDVHHKIKIVVRPDLRLSASNCVGLCSDCHDRRTARGE